MCTKIAMNLLFGSKVRISEVQIEPRVYCILSNRRGGCLSLKLREKSMVGGASWRGCALGEELVFQYTISGAYYD